MMHTSDHVDNVGQQRQDDIEGTATETHRPLTSNETEDNLPPLSSYIDGWQFWWKFAKFPVVFVIINAILIYTSVVQYDEHDNKGYQFNKPGQLMDPALEVMKHYSVVLGFLFMVDTVILYRGALYIEKQVDALRLQESNDNVVASTATSSLTHVHAKVSKMVDQVLCQGNAAHFPEVSFFVNILFLLTGLSVAATAVSFSMNILLHSTMASSNCIIQVPLEVQAIPPALHGWAFPSPQTMDRPMALRSTHVHMVDGTTYFAGVHPTRRELGIADAQPMLLAEEGPYGTLRSFGQVVSSSTAIMAHNVATPSQHSLSPILLAAGPDGTLNSYPQFLKPRAFTSFAGRNDEASEGFCCSYSNATNTTSPDPRDFLFDDNSRWTANVLCIGGREGSHGKDERTMNLPVKGNDQQGRKSVEIQDVSVRSHDGIVWVRLQLYHFQREYAMHLEIYSLNPQTMDLTFITNTTVDHERQDGGSPCLRLISPLPYLVAAPILFLVAYWLLKCRDIPAGVTSLCLGVVAWLVYADDKSWPSVLAMVSVGATISLCTSLPPWLSRDMILWGLYTSLVMATLAEVHCWLDCADFYLLGMLAVGIGLVLNHPVLQIMGWLGMVFTFFIAAESVINGMQDPIIVPVALLISSGLLSLGSYVQTHLQKKYRTYVMFHAGRLLRFLAAEMAPINETSLRQGGHNNQ
jgi:hypothetical protein